LREEPDSVYFVDPGLAAYLSGINHAVHVHRDPLVGGLFENPAVLEALKARMNRGLDSDLYFFRDNNGN
jgi:predicted AAA+ superfamily ATPase